MAGELLLVEDDAVFSAALGRALERRGFVVTRAADAAAALQDARRTQPAYAVVDLKLGADNGLELIPELRQRVPDIRILLLTGYASIATAVEAIKRGAHDYLAKPVDADAVVHALLDEGGTQPEVTLGIPDTPLALRRVEWEHIQRTLVECDGNISETARRLGMHRRTLQRKLAKRPVHERGDVGEA
ncbi:MAG: response regulator transcription factor [Nevskiaceae bacterium]|nr:MAG: response regulator transcription factor [Nevskiaceae bacterium]TBR72097.1 MAG: response regulator transcription factor [Nevskiaceae bacterium]